jgi:hypothetical protein
MSRLAGGSTLPGRSVNDNSSSDAMPTVLFCQVAFVRRTQDETRQTTPVTWQIKDEIQADCFFFFRTQ